MNEIAINNKGLEEFKKVSRTIEVRLSDIVRDEKFNSRKVMGDIPAFAETIKKNKYFTTPVVIESEKKYFLVAGFRRCAAWELLYGKDAIVKVDVMDFKSEEDAILFNLAENTGRNDLRKYDICEKIYDLCEKRGLKQDTAASKIMRTQGYVSACLKIWKDLIPEIKKIWGRIEDPAMEPSFAVLKDLTKGTPSEQKEAWEKYAGGKTDWNENLGLSGPSEPEKEKVQARKKKEVLDKLKDLSSKFEDEGDTAKQIEYKNQIAALKWTLGQRKTL